MAEVSIDALKGLIRAKEIQPGDLVLLENGEHGLLNLLIRRTQVRLLSDLYHLPRSAARPESFRAAARFTHAACVLEPACMGEMFWPRARSIAWEDRLRPGMRIRVRRPLLPDRTPAPVEMRQKIAMACWCDVFARTPYPLRELLYYWVVSWGRKLWLGHKFADIFRSERADVCSGRYWLWCRRAGLFEDADGGDARPEAWYPARLAVTDRFATVGEYVIAEQGAAEPVARPLQAEGAAV